MYDKEKKVRRGEKFYSYWHLVEWRRVDGKVRQKVVEYLGPFLDRLAAELTVRLRGLVCGADGCGSRGVVEKADSGRLITSSLREEHSAHREPVAQ
jgi:hypothetical protein